MAAKLAAVLVLVGCGRFGFDDVAPRDTGNAAACGPGSEVEYVAPTPVMSAKWVAPGGSDLASGASKAEAWATFAHAMPLLRPGDTLVIADGTYLQAMKATVSGQLGKPIVIRAETDGGAIIDGGGTTNPCVFDNFVAGPVTDLIVEGIQCRNGNPDVIRLFETERLTFRRVSGYEAKDNGVIFHVSNSSDILVEDSAGAGRADLVFYAYTSNRVTFRRAWAHWMASTNMYNADFNFLDTNDSVIENCVATMDPSATIYAEAMQINASLTSVTRANRNLVFGNVSRNPGGWGLVVASPVVRIEDNRVINNVFLGGSGGIFQRADASFAIERATIVGQTAWNSSSANPSADPKDADFVMNVRIANTVIANSPSGIAVTSTPYLGTISLEYNNVFSVTVPYAGVATAGVDDVAIDPVFDTEQFGTGAYLRGPTALGVAANGQPMGARVLYRANAGVLSGEPLWPWPMEARIRRETGMSVTWEDGGGIWRTLCGVY